MKIPKQAAVKPAQGSADEGVVFSVITRRREFDRRTAGQKRFDLLNHAQLGFVHVDHHLPDDQPAYCTITSYVPSGSYLIGKGENTAIAYANVVNLS